MKTESSCRKPTKWPLAALLISAAALCAVGEDEKLPAAKWDFESSDGLAMKKCAILAEPGNGKAVFGGKVGMSMFSVGYSGMIDDVTIYNRALTDDEVRCMATNTNICLSVEGATRGVAGKITK